MQESQTETKINYLNNLFAESFGYSLSNKYREEKQIKDRSLTYGEIKFAEFAKLFKIFQPTADKIFYDLGSGTGKPCFAAAFLAGFKKSVGIELLPSLHQKAQELKSLIPKEYKNYADKLNFVEGDFLKEDFLDADVVFCNSTCFSMEIFEALIAKIKNLKAGSFVITLTKRIDLDEFKIIYESSDIEYSWGKPTTLVYQKI